MPFTLSQKKALAIVPHVSGPLSMVGSFFIVRMVLIDKHKKSLAYHRLMLGMSCCDFMTSFWYSLSTWPIPRGTPNVWAGFGNTASCTAQGFFIQLGLATPLYNASLSIYYLLIGRYNWEEARIRQVEPYLHAVPLLVGSLTAIAGLPLKLFNNANLWCWIAPFPLGCKDSYTFRGQGDCVRGDNAWIFRWAFFYGPLWACILVAMIAMLLVYFSVLRQEKKTDKFQESGVVVRKHSRRVASQSFWYIVAFYVSWTSATLMRLLQTIPATRGKSYYAIALGMAIFTPLQGLLNFMVYTRARYLKYRRENPDVSSKQAVVATLANSRASQGGQSKNAESSEHTPSVEQVDSVSHRNMSTGLAPIQELESEFERSSFRCSRQEQVNLAHMLQNSVRRASESSFGR